MSRAAYVECKNEYRTTSCKLCGRKLSWPIGRAKWCVLWPQFERSTERIQVRNGTAWYRWLSRSHSRLPSRWFGMFLNRLLNRLLSRSPSRLPNRSSGRFLTTFLSRLPNSLISSLPRVQHKLYVMLTGMFRIQPDTLAEAGCTRCF